MKFGRFYPKHATLSLLIFGFVATASVQAQTVQSQSGQNESNELFSAVMYPMNDSSPGIKVNFNNLSKGSVRVVLRNQQGKALYDEYEPTARYRRRFDLSAAPAGEYTIELSKRDKQYTQTFVIDAPVGRRIALKTEPNTDKNLAVKQ